jgi:hypothetical protein
MKDFTDIATDIILFWDAAYLHKSSFIWILVLN